MKRHHRIFSRLSERLDRRMRVARPGSVLILCVALLVLLALIGTAMISSSRTDRYTSAQNTTNTQVDLLLEGMKQVAETAIVNDLYNTNTGVQVAPQPNPGLPIAYEYRRPRNPYSATDYPLPAVLKS